MIWSLMPIYISSMPVADHIWIALALLHREFPDRDDFSKDEIRSKLDESGLSEGTKRSSVNAHLKQHLVANVKPSSTKRYRMLFETRPGRIRLFRPGDFIDHERRHSANPKQAPSYEEIATEYRSLLDWYETWSKGNRTPDAPIDYDADPLIRLIGSGKHIWADEHADEYVENLRREDR